MSVNFQQIIPILRIFDVQKAKEFYCGFLGFEIEWEHHFDDDSPAYLSVSRDGMTLHLSEHHGDCTPGSTVFVSRFLILRTPQASHAGTFDRYILVAMARCGSARLAAECSRGAAIAASSAF